ncbi:CrcB protein [Plasticicumulans lactativorans]|uniref:Fluoride-specific ion channel FluC n=1 Tax=Plasticicumulans lactativorans TaxID=1133106 RepID=A0A4R2L3J7_9GAMM|nr:fluoride efflux transporter CrcB [Plasticicumulans lactativorans]TCO81750.1 CrcB protein [Plasticicumulans lactativorans]
MGLYGFLAVGIGAASGAWLRWWLGLQLNPLFPTLPFGTLAANLLGGYLMGLTLGFFEHFQALPPETRLLVATGFLGGLTTFSTFSAEIVTLILRHEFAWAAAAVAAHVLGSFAMTALGIFTIRVTLYGWRT